MNEEIDRLASLDGVTGLCHHRGGIIQWQRLPDSLSRDSAAALCANVSKAFTAYHSADRTLTSAYLEFPPHSILVTARPPSSAGEPPREFLTFLLSGRAAAAAVSAAAAAWQTSAS